MATRFRKLKTRKVKSKALKTRKHRGGNGLLERLGLTRKSPLSSASSNNIASMNRLPTSGRAASIDAFKKSRIINQKKTEFAKRLRNHINRMKSLNEQVKQQAFNLMNVNSREKMKALLENPTNLNSLSDAQLLELYTTGKVRSKSI